MLRLGGFIRNICQVCTLRLSAPPDLLTSRASRPAFSFAVVETPWVLFGNARVGNNTERRRQSSWVLPRDVRRRYKRCQGLAIASQRRVLPSRTGPRRRSARGRPVARRNRHHAGANSSISAWVEGNDSLSANPKLLWAVSDVGLFPRRGSVYRMADGGRLTECLPH